VGYLTRGFGGAVICFWWRISVRQNLVLFIDLPNFDVDDATTTTRRSTSRTCDSGRLQARHIWLGAPQIPFVLRSLFPIDFPNFDVDDDNDEEKQEEQKEKSKEEEEEEKNQCFCCPCMLSLPAVPAC